MIIKTTQIENLINNKTISAYSLEEKIGISRSLISGYRNKTYDIFNMSIKNAMTIQKFINEEYKFSIPYDRLIHEIEADYDDLDEYILVEKEFVDSIDDYIVIDYFNVDGFDPEINTLKIEFMKKDLLLKELKELNSMF